MYNTVFKRLLDIEILSVSKGMFSVPRWRNNLHVSEFTVLSKSIRPLPVVKEKDGVLYDAVTDPR
jgi:lysyl-tRNA synthetase class 2